MKNITLPDWNTIAENILKYESWGPEPLEKRLARELEDAYNKGKSKGIREAENMYNGDIGYA